MHRKIYNRGFFRTYFKEYLWKKDSWQHSLCRLVCSLLAATTALLRQVMVANTSATLRLPSLPAKRCLSARCRWSIRKTSALTISKSVPAQALSITTALCLLLTLTSVLSLATALMKITRLVARPLNFRSRACGWTTFTLWTKKRPTWAACLIRSSSSIRRQWSAPVRLTFPSIRAMTLSWWARVQA